MDTIFDSVVHISAISVYIQYIMDAAMAPRGIVLRKTLTKVHRRDQEADPALPESDHPETSLKFRIAILVTLWLTDVIVAHVKDSLFLFPIFISDENDPAA